MCSNITPSWILSYAENPASFSLQDGATEWHDYERGTHPPTQQVPNLTYLVFSLIVGGNVLFHGCQYDDVWRVSGKCLRSGWKVSGIGVRHWCPHCPHPNCFPHQQSMCCVLPPSMCFFSYPLFPTSRKYVRCPPYQYMFFCVVPSVPLPLWLRLGF